MLGELLLELQSEEIPARMQQRAAEDLARLVTDGLKKAGLSFESHQAFVTPRRLALRTTPSTVWNCCSSTAAYVRRALPNSSVQFQ